jgi:WD40 repeat protein
MNNHKYQEIIDDLLWVIDPANNEFSLTFARCNYPQLQSDIMSEINRVSEYQISELFLNDHAINLYQEIANFSQNKQIHTLVVTGLENVINLDKLLGSTNLQRERFRSDFHFNIIIWVNDVILNKFAQLAKDFQTWGGIALRFNITLEDLISYSQTIIDKLFNHIMEVGTAEFLSNESILGHSYNIQFNSINTDFQELGADLPLTLQGAIAFIRGRDLFRENKLYLAIKSYQNCVNIWQNSLEISPLKPAILQFHLGLASYNLSYKEDKLTNLQKAKNYLENCLNVFEQENRPDLVGKFINFLGEILRSLDEWENLKVLANKSISLNENNPSFLEPSYGFLAEVCLQKSLLQDALNWVNLIRDNRENGIYLVLLSLINENLGNHESAIATEEKAINLDVPNLQRFYFLDLLEKLANLYFTKKEYLTAYQTKLNIQSLKQQYGLIAFVGAGRIKASKNEVANLSQEITSSGRKSDVDKLCDRIRSINNKVTIIYGQSGVGKSSILEAGLIPALLQKKYIENKEILPINLRVYHSWKEGLGILLTIKGAKFYPSENPETKLLEYTTDSLIEILKNNDQNGIITMLFFDQFEEFFFVNQSQTEINEFFHFVAECLKIVYVKLIFSLREDYIYLLLRGTRNRDLDAINNDILNKNILYYLHNLSTTVTTGLITNLTNRCDFNLEPRLIEELVRDLTTDLGDVRPIELQIIGSQLQTEGITTLDEYNKLGTGKERKEKLVNRYLEDVVSNCGEENIEIAQVVLYLLINEKDNTRPLKTKIDIIQSLEGLEFEKKEDKLELVLEIFVRSGLVMLLPEKPNYLYQLVHDYLVDVIRQQQGNSLLEKLKQVEAERDQYLILLEEKNKAEVEKEKLLTSLEAERDQYRTLLQQKEKTETEKEKEKAEKEKEKAEKEKEITAKLRWLNYFKIVSFFLVVASGLAIIFGFNAYKSAQKATKNQEIIALSNSSDAYYNLSPQLLNSILEALKAVKKSQENPEEIEQKTKLFAQNSLQQSLYNNKGLDFREKNRLIGHNDAVNSIAFSPDGKTIVSGSDDKTIKLWTKEGKLLQTFNDTSKVTSLAFSPDGQTIISGSDDKTIKLWSKEGKPLQTLKNHTQTIKSVAVSKDGLIASGSDDNTIKLRSKEGKLLHTLKGHTGAVKSVAFSTDGNIIISASADNTIKLWSKEGKLLQTLKNHTQTLKSVAVSKDGLIASGSDDNTIKLRSKEGKLLHTLKGHTGAVKSVAFSTDGNIIISASADNTIKLWSKEGKLLQTLSGHAGEINSVAFSTDGNTIASASSDNTIKLWSKEVKRVQTLSGHKDSVRSIAISKDPQTIVSGSSDNTIKLWNKEGKLLQTLDGKDGHQSRVLSVAISQDAQTIASGSDDNTVKLWDKKGKLLQTLTGHQNSVLSVAISPDGQTIASASYDKTIKLWSKEGKLLHTLKDHQGPVFSVAFAPDGQTIASGSDDKTIKLWNKEGKLLQTFKDHTGKVNSVAFSPDGKYIVSGSADKTIKLWDKEGKLLQTLTGHQNDVLTLAFSTDGKYIVSGSADKTIKLWSKEGDLLQTLTGHQNFVRSVTFSPDGKIISGSIDRTIKIWTLIPDGELVNKGCEWVGDYLKNSAEVSESDRHLCD